jgi:hypothetical protein
LAEAIQDNLKNRSSNNLAKCKISFLSTERVRKQRAFDLRCEEAKLRKEESKLQEWSTLRDNIKKLRNELNNENISETEKEELKNDIEGLLLRKNLCAKYLGMEK